MRQILGLKSTETRGSPVSSLTSSQHSTWTPLAVASLALHLLSNSNHWSPSNHVCLKSQDICTKVTTIIIRPQKAAHSHTEIHYFTVRISLLTDRRRGKTRAPVRQWLYGEVDQCTLQHRNKPRPHSLQLHKPRPHYVQATCSVHSMHATDTKQQSSTGCTT